MNCDESKTKMVKYVIIGFVCIIALIVVASSVEQYCKMEIAKAVKNQPVEMEKAK
jgi:hypothetical protein